MSKFSLEPTFGALKQRILVLGGVSGAGWACVGSIALLLVGVVLDLVWELPEIGRLCSLLGTAVLGLSIFVACLAFALRQTRDALLARKLDQTAQGGGQIVTGFELDQNPDAAGKPSELSAGLAEIAIQRATQLAEQVPEYRVFPSRPMKRAVLSAVGLCAAVFLLVCLAPRAAFTEWVRFADPFGDHPPFSYTQLEVTPGNTEVRYGDPLEVVAVTSGPAVDEMEVVLRTVDDKGQPHDEALPMFPEPHGQWRARIDTVTVPAQYFVRANSTRSHRYQLGIITVPEIEEVKFRVTPPAYTRDAVYEGPLPQGGISALAGSVIEVRARSNRPLQSGQVQLPGEKSASVVELKPVSADGTAHEVAGQWQVQQAGTILIEVSDTAGQKCRERYTGTINLLQDQVPIVRLLEPAPQSLATPSVPLPITISAEDDYGISKLQLYRSLNDSRATPVSLPVANPAERHLEEQTALPLTEYGLQPGDVIKLYARVEDNDPAGAKGFESPLAVIQIVSDEELQKLLRTREGLDLMMAKYQAAQRQMESLKEELEQLQKQLEKRDAEGQLTDGEREQMEQLAKQIDEAAKEVAKSANDALPYDLDQSLKDELEQLSKKMEQVAQEAQKAAQQPNSTAGQAAQQLARLQKQLGQEQEQLQAGVNDPLDRLSEMYPLLEDQARFEDLYQRQRELADRLDSLKDQAPASDPAVKSRMRDLEAEQAQNRADLDSLLDDIENHAARLPANKPELQELAQSAKQFAQACRQSGAGESMSNAEAGLSEFSGTRGAGESKSAADKMEALLSQCQGMGDQAGQACQGLQFKPGAGSLGDTLNQLLADGGFKSGKPGQNPQDGVGNGGGFSARRSTLSNIGLYGKIPAKGNPTPAAGRGKSELGTIGGSYRNDQDRIATSRLDPHGHLKSTGTSEAAIPSRYRQRVQQYFQRIAEESPVRSK